MSSSNTQFGAVPTNLEGACQAVRDKAEGIAGAVSETAKAVKHNVAQMATGAAGAAEKTWDSTRDAAREIGSEALTARGNPRGRRELHPKLPSCDSSGCLGRRRAPGRRVVCRNPRTRIILFANVAWWNLMVFRHLGFFSRHSLQGTSTVPSQKGPDHVC